MNQASYANQQKAQNLKSSGLLGGDQPKERPQTDLIRDRLEGVLQQVTAAEVLVHAIATRTLGSIPETEGEGKSEKPSNGCVEEIHSLISGIEAHLTYLHNQINRIGRL